MEQRDTGVVLRARPLTETSLVVHWLTELSGRIATVAKGARRPKSPFRGKLDLFQVDRIAFQRSRRGDLHTLREAVPAHSYPGLRASIQGLRTAAHAARLLERLLESDSPVPGAYRLLLRLLDQASARPENPLPLLWFEWHLLTDQGLAPAPDQVRLSPAGRAILRQIHNAPDSPPPIQLSPPQHQELRALLDHLHRAQT